MIEPSGPPSSISIVIPAFNEEATLPALVQSLAVLAGVREILVIDDASSDATAAVASTAGARVVSHRRRRGNGAAVKTGLQQAAADWVLVVDADGQHHVEDVRRLMAFSSDEDLVVGARDFVWGHFRDFGNLVLSGLATAICRFPIPDLTSGLRRLHRVKALQFFDFYPEGYSFPTTSTMLFVTSGYTVQFASIPNRPRPTHASLSKLRPIPEGFRFLSMICRVVLLSYPFRVFASVGGILFFLGVIWTLHTLSWSGQVSAAGALLLLTGVMLFFFGTIADQLSQIRRSMSRLGR